MLMTVHIHNKSSHVISIHPLSSKLLNFRYYGQFHIKTVMFGHFKKGTKTQKCNKIDNFGLQGMAFSELTINTL